MKIDFCESNLIDFVDEIQRMFSKVITSTVKYNRWLSKKNYKYCSRNNISWNA